MKILTILLLLYLWVCNAQQAPDLPPIQNVDVNPSARRNWLQDANYPNLYPFGYDLQDSHGDRKTLDQKLRDVDLNNGHTIDLNIRFPFYGGWYNYTVLSVHGYLSFATVYVKGLDFNVGPDEVPEWPAKVDPALMGPYVCSQKIADSGIQIRTEKPGVWYRLVVRSDMQNKKQTGQRQRSHMVWGPEHDLFLDKLQRDLEEGMVGASSFRPAAALVVTWSNVAPSTGSSSDQVSSLKDKRSTYQLVWMTDRQGTLSYVIINYGKLGYSSADVGGNGKMGRCKALFNGGNNTGMVFVDSSDKYKDDPSSLATRSAVPHVVGGRHLFRVDDVVRRGGCSNKTGGTYPIMIHPNIVNMLGETTVDVNAMCLDPATSYNLQIATRGVAKCDRLNAAIARCTLPKVMNWGTLEVYFQPESGGTGEEKAYKGFIYFVPPTFDPMMLEIGQLDAWFANPPELRHIIKWYPRNFTNPEWRGVTGDFSTMNDQAKYNVMLQLVVFGYTETRDLQRKKYVPKFQELAVIADNIQNKYEPEYAERTQIYELDLKKLERQQLVFNNEHENPLNYRFGYLKLMLKPRNNERRSGKYTQGLVSSPIPLHWLWKLYEDRDLNNIEEYTKSRANRMCLEWYEEDGTQWNFIQDTETNASCPCKVTQAKMDLGRFMPHPRCSKYFRDMQCTVNMGSATCFMSAQNVYSSFPGFSGQAQTQYGQVCCYDEKGYLMHTHYQPLVKTSENYPYSPGFPQRAFELGTEPFQSQFQVPGMSSFQYDAMPYFFCCKWADNRCQLFYWRRPTSGCQEYRPPNLGTVMGGGHFETLDGWKFTFNEPGVFTLLHIPETLDTENRPKKEEVKIQVRLERYPDRTVDFSSPTINQEDLVQPLNITVVTGIAMKAGDSEIVQVALRKDTRRFKYRTSIMVGGVLRYFDNMQMQRYRGVLVYVNAVNKGLSEVFVVLEQARIGVRIRESFVLDIDREQAYRESPGLLDLMLSVSPEYGIPNDGKQSNMGGVPSPYERSDAVGLMRPFPNEQRPVIQKIKVIDEGHRRQLINNYLVQGTGNSEVDPNKPQEENLFRTTDEYKVWPGHSLIEKDVYQTASKYHKTFRHQTDQDVEEKMRNCQGAERNLGAFQQTNINFPRSMSEHFLSEYGYNCRAIKAAEVDTLCGSYLPCRYDYTLLYQSKIAHETRYWLKAYEENRREAEKRYNSCGAVNMEYPEYLYVNDPIGSKYLAGDTVKFECYQSHWIKGDTQYSCELRYYDTYGRPVYEWNHGWQPWCRTRTKETAFKWLAAIAGVLLILALIAAIFIICWFIKRKRIKERYSDEKRMIKDLPDYTREPSAFPRNSKPLAQPTTIHGGYQPIPPVTIADKNSRAPPHRPKVLPETASPPEYNHNHPFGTSSNRSSSTNRTPSRTSPVTTKRSPKRELDTAV